MLALGLIGLSLCAWGFIAVMYGLGGDFDAGVQHHFSDLLPYAVFANLGVLAGSLFAWARQSWWPLLLGGLLALSPFALLAIWFALL